MSELELVVALLVVVALLTVVARRIGVPYPILMTLGGLLLGLVPGIPRLELAPEMVFILILPPLLFAAAFFTSPRELWRNIRPISLLAVGLGLATTLAGGLGVQGKAPGIGWGRR